MIFRVSVNGGDILRKGLVMGGGGGRRGAVSRSKVLLFGSEITTKEQDERKWRGRHGGKLCARAHTNLRHKRNDVPGWSKVGCHSDWLNYLAQQGLRLD